jgi:4'-phosphopantetheinyl transferase superfamily
VDLNLFVNSIKAHFKIKFLALHVDARFSSSAPDARLQIRQDIISNYSPLLSSFEKRAILNLDTLPVVENLFFSISHNKSIGGYAACDQKIGFDLEEISRITNETVARVCTAAEMAVCPDFKLLWSAKEALVKLAGAAKKMTYLMSDFQITEWEQVDGQLLSFKALDKNNVVYKGISSNETFNGIPCTLALAIYS